MSLISHGECQYVECRFADCRCVVNLASPSSDEEEERFTTFSGDKLDENVNDDDQHDNDTSHTSSVVVTLV